MSISSTIVAAFAFASALLAALVCAPLCAGVKGGGSGAAFAFAFAALLAALVCASLCSGVNGRGSGAAAGGPRGSGVLALHLNLRFAAGPTDDAAAGPPDGAAAGSRDVSLLLELFDCFLLDCFVDDLPRVGASGTPFRCGLLPTTAFTSGYTLSSNGSKSPLISLLPIYLTALEKGFLM